MQLFLYSENCFHILIKLCYVMCFGFLLVVFNSNYLNMNEGGTEKWGVPDINENRKCQDNTARIIRENILIHFFMELVFCSHFFLT